MTQFPYFLTNKDLKSVLCIYIQPSQVNTLKTQFSLSQL